MKNERRSFKEYVKANKGKIIVGASIITTGALAILLCKSKIDLSKVSDKVNVLETALTEGVFEEAIATTTRKINSRKDRIVFLRNRKDYGDEIIISQIENELKILTERRESFIQAQHSLGIDE